METVQIQCGSCNRIMAISVEHLGGQVHCPHCQAIVQAPSRPDEKKRPDESESIFAGPEASDDIFGHEPKPLVEMPVDKSPPPTRGSETIPYMLASTIPPDFSLEKPADEPSAPSPPAWTDSPAGADTGEPLPGITPRRLEKQGSFAPILLIFLIPYSLLATGVVVYLLMNQARAFDPLERLPDPKPNPKDGGPRQLQVAHDLELPSKLRTKLNQTLRIGDVEVTPTKVEMTPEHLILNLKVKNVSKDLIFNPISDDFLRYAVGSVSAKKPYSFLQWNDKRLYGGFPEWLQGAEGKEEPFGGEIGPGQEELIRIVTQSSYKDEVKPIADSKDNLLWRVQVRRGLVDVRGTKVSATAVVGVEFNARAIQPES